MKRILIVDDDVRLLDTMRKTLNVSSEYKVMTEDSGRRALAAVATFKPDLIVLDMNMPGMGGVEFLKEISTPDGELKYPVLVLTSRANMAEFFANVAVDGFVAKPCDPDDFRKEVDRIIARRGAEQKSILIGEDDRAVRERLLDAFRNAGYVVDSVADGARMVEKAIVERPTVILVKCILTNLNGEAVARMLKEMPNTKDIPVVLYDGRQDAEDESIFAPLKPGVKKYVKGDSPKVLLSAVAAVLAHRAEDEAK